MQNNTYIMKKPWTWILKTRTGVELFAHSTNAVQVQKHGQEAHMPTSERGFLWGEREGTGAGQGNTWDHNFLSDVLFLKKTQMIWRNSSGVFFPLRDEWKGRQNVGSQAQDEWTQAGVAQELIIVSSNSSSGVSLAGDKKCPPPTPSWWIPQPLTPGGLSLSPTHARPRSGLWARSHHRAAGRPPNPRQGQQGV